MGPGRTHLYRCNEAPPVAHKQPGLHAVHAGFTAVQVLQARGAASQALHEGVTAVEVAQAWGATGQAVHAGVTTVQVLQALGAASQAGEWVHAPAHQVRQRRAADPPPGPP